MGQYHIECIGVREVWGAEEAFSLSPHSRAQHTLIVGKTGTGKSNLLHNLILGDIWSGRGVTVLDPHGDLSRDILECYPKSRADDLVAWSPGEMDFSLSMNPLADVRKDERHLVVSGIVSSLKSIWRESFGPRMEFILNVAIESLLDCECPGISLLSLQRLLSDKKYRVWVIKHLKDPMLRAIWTNEIDQWDERFRREAFAPIQNKIGAMLLPPLRGVYGQVRNRMKMEEVLDRGQVLVANLSRGAIGEERSSLCGALLLAKIQHTALRRANLPEQDRFPHFLYIDEFATFTGDSIKGLLSEARKYGVSVCIATQHLSSLPDDIVDSILGNVGNIISFRVGDRDASVLAREFGGDLSPAVFTQLPNHEVIMRKVDGGNICDPFFGKTLRAHRPRGGKRATLVRRSQERFCTPRSVVDDKISRWLRKGW